MREQNWSNSSFLNQSATTLATIFLVANWAHWDIEDRLHWALDISFCKGDACNRVCYEVEDFLTLRHMAANLGKQEKSGEGGNKAKRMYAAWDNDYLVKVLSRNM